MCSSTRHTMNMYVKLISTLLALSTVFLAPGYAQSQDDPESPSIADQSAALALLEKSIESHVDRHAFTGELDSQAFKNLRDFGEQLFRAKFTLADGVGRPWATQAIIPTKRKRRARQAFSRTAGMDANACSSCHNDPKVGGAGDFTANVFVSEGFNNVDFDNTDPQFSNERNTNHLFGAGLIELLAREMTQDLHKIRSQALQDAKRDGAKVRTALHSKGVEFGYLTTYPDGVVDTTEIEGCDVDLVIKPFSQKGVMTSLRQFSINALNHHHGMQASERFGARWTGEHDFDADRIADELTPGDISALVAWQSALPPPQPSKHQDPQRAAAQASGMDIFSNIGCNECHRTSLPLVSMRFSDPGPYDSAGTLRESDVDSPTIYDLALLDWSKQLKQNAKGEVLVPLFGDLKRHRIADQEIATLGNELLAQRFVDRDVFMTAELWGVAATAPYGHRGDLTTLHEVISAHGGEARNARDNYLKLSEAQRGSVILFLKSLTIQP